MVDEYSILESVVAALKDAGYDVYAQLYGYLKTGDDACITRRGGAREKIKAISKSSLAQYVTSIAPDNNGKGE